jgi:hypothetical protein
MQLDLIETSLVEQLEHASTTRHDLQSSPSRRTLVDFTSHASWRTRALQYSDEPHSPRPLTSMPLRFFGLVLTACRHLPSGLGYNLQQHS